nr:ATP synthase F0 subunit 8 [Caeparia donskoffi]WGO57174.1 ATP synthase F0 subunit 8 [Caeparia donskoffi]
MFFILIFFMFSFINYYSFIPLPKSKKMIPCSKSMNWKW